MNRRRSQLGAVAAAVLALMQVSPVSATTWNHPEYIGPGWPSDVAVFGDYGAAALYIVPEVDDWDAPAELYLRRRIEWRGLPIWLSAQLLAANARFNPTYARPAMAASGDALDVVYVNMRNRLAYLHSANAGATFPDRARLLSPKGLSVSHGAIARHGDLVAVAWTTDNTVWLRISTDGGAHFTRAKQFTGFEPSLAIGEGVMYLAYRRGRAGLFLRTSFDNGETWTKPTIISSTARGYSYRWGNVTAVSATAYIAWATWTDAPVVKPFISYRRTFDRGFNWSSGTQVDPDSGGYWGSYAPLIELQGKVARVIWARCMLAMCADADVYYREINDAGFTAREYVSAYDVPGGVGLAEKILVLHGDVADSSIGPVKVRSGTP